MATGLLVLLIGKATKVSQYLMSLDKQYTGTVHFGIETDSQDADGEVVNTLPVPELNEAYLKSTMAEFIGDQYQIPPMFSAKKVSGQALHINSQGRGRQSLVSLELFVFSVLN